MTILRQIFLNLLLFFSILSFSQTVDTINIYKDQAGISYRKYKRAWKFRAGSYTLSPDKMNAQDSLVMTESKKKFYLKVYSKPKGRLLFEGGRWDDYTLLNGEIKYYYPSGQLKRIENWDANAGIDTCGIALSIGDGPAKWGKWKYFRKVGTIKKEINHFLKPYCDTKVLEEIEQTIIYSKKGLTKRKKEKVIYTCKDCKT